MMQIDKIFFTILVTCSLIFSFTNAKAQSHPTNNAAQYAKNKEKSLIFTHKAVAGLNVGATTPLPISNRFSNFSWKPLLSPYIGWEFTLSGNHKTGFTSGIHFHKKGMIAAADVYQIFTQVELDEMSVRGYFTGNNKTEIDNLYLSMPLLFTYRLQRYNFYVGASLNYLLKGKFSGSVSDGYIRIDEPTGPRTDIDNSPYSFNEEFKKFDFALACSVERSITRNIYITGGLSMSLGSVMKADFKGMEGSFKNVYANLGMAYYFNVVD